MAYSYNLLLWSFSQVFLINYFNSNYKVNIRRTFFITETNKMCFFNYYNFFVWLFRLNYYILICQTVTRNQDSTILFAKIIYFDTNYKCKDKSALFLLIRNSWWMIWNSNFWIGCAKSESLHSFVRISFEQLIVAPASFIYN